MGNLKQTINLQMQKLIIATLATATLGKNIAVQNMLIKHTDALEHGPKGSSSAPDQARIKMDLGADGEIRDNVAGTGLHGRVVKNGLHGRVGNRDRVGGLRDRLTKAGFALDFLLELDSIQKESSSN